MSEDRTKLPHLEVVPGGVKVTSGSVLSLESLAPEERERVSHYLRLSGGAGVTVGVIRGGRPWDLRPLVLSNGVLSIVRVSDPSGAADQIDQLRELHSRLMVHPLRPKGQSSGFGDGIIWVLRPFFDRVLADGGIALEATQFARQLIELVKGFHQAGIIHGHISADNIGYIDGKPALLDFGFRAITKSSYERLSTVAPEIYRGAAVEHSVDMFGIGLVLERVSEISASAKYGSLVRRLLAPEKKERPTLAEVEREVSPYGSGKLAEPGAGTSPGLSSGRLITGQIGTPIDTPEVDPEPRRPIHETFSLPKSPEAQAPSKPANRESNKQPNSRITILYFVLIVFVALAGAAYFRGWFSLDSDSPLISRDSLLTYWESGDEDLMRIVATAAVNQHDQAARSVIIDDALKGNERPKVNARLIKNALRPEWRDRLKESDYLLILQLATLAYLGQTELPLPPVANAFPGVQLALAGSLSMTGGAGELTTVPLTRLSELPDPYRFAFNELSTQGIKLLGEKPAFGLAHLLTEDFSAEAFQAVLFNDQKGSEINSGRLTLLLVAGAEVKGLDTALLAFLSSTNTEVAKLLKWFNGSEESPGAVDWTTAPPRLKLSLVVGTLPRETLTQEQYLDLFTFPLQSIRNAVVEDNVKNKTIPDQRVVLRFLASPANKLRRIETVFLLSILSQQEATSVAREALFAKFFEQRPDPQTVLALLLLLQEEGSGTFAFQSSQYLAASELEIKFSFLEQLSIHREPLARALAVTKLDPAKPNERKLLEAMTGAEKSEKLKQLILDKLR